MARTVTDAAKLLGVLAGFDPEDPATAACLIPGNCHRDYTKFLERDALRGARIAVPHFGYWTALCNKANCGDNADGLHHTVISAEQQEVMNDAIRVLRERGAIVDEAPETPNLPADPTQPVALPDIPSQRDLLNFPGCSPSFDADGHFVKFVPASCSTVLFFGFKRDLNDYLAANHFGPGQAVDEKTIVHSLADVIAFNTARQDVALKYGQGLAIASDALVTTSGSSDTTR